MHDGQTVIDDHRRHPCMVIAACQSSYIMYSHATERTQNAICTAHVEVNQWTCMHPNWGLAAILHTCACLFSKFLWQEWGPSTWGNPLSIVMRASPSVTWRSTLQTWRWLGLLFLTTRFRGLFGVTFSRYSIYLHYCARTHDYSSYNTNDWHDRTSMAMWHFKVVQLIYQ